MKKLVTISGIIILAMALTAPLYAYRGGRGGPGGYCWQEGRRGGDLTADQRNALAELEEKFYKDTSELRRQIWSKSDELDTVMNASDPGAQKAKALQKEISALKAEMAEKKIDLELEANKIAPDDRYARGCGRGYGGPMRGHQRQHRGYGPGSCWD
jgi:Spy/CpxP family protein refolding chaperone